jgi:dihydrofolate synthase/folylpolyglutamate synthase
LLHRLLTINTERKVRLGISTTQKLIAALGPAYSLDPDIPVIHVAGSNGKGSTTLKIARALQLHGLRVGVYTSPHVSSFRERIAVNGVPLSEEEFVELLPPMLDVASDRSDIPATFFELGTVLAFAHFRHAQVDVAVLEVGLGGRLDSTNVIAAPELSVICSIALEHTAWLGPTLQHIAREKAGILKRGRPALLGSSVPLDVVQQVASEVSAGPIEQLTRRFDDYDKENSTLAARAVQLAVEHSPRLQLLLQQSTAGGLRKDLVAQGVRVRPPCRFQQLRWNAREQRAVYLDEDGSRSGALPWDSSNAYLQPSATLRVSDARRQPGEIDVVLDVCHNPTAFERLFEKLQHEYGSISTASQATVSPPIHAVVGFSSDKEFLPCLELLMRHCRSVHLVEADTPRAARAETVLQQAQEAGLPQRFPKCTLTITSRSPYDTLTRVLDGASEEASAPPSSATPPVVLCCGTFFIMSDVRRALRLPHPIDPVPINEQSLTRSEDDGGAQHAAANRR